MRDKFLQKCYNLMKRGTNLNKNKTIFRKERQKLDNFTKNWTILRKIRQI